LAAKYEDFSAGFDFQLEFPKEVKEEKEEAAPLFKNYNFGATYQTNNLLLAALVEKSLTSAKLGVEHKVNDKTTLGFEFSHKLKKSEPFVVQAGFSRVLDQESNVRAKLLSTGVASVAYQVKVKPELKATVSLEMSAKELSNVGKIGFELAFEPLD
jgi:hypothetical protein